MELKGERIIPASVDVTWEALNTPDVLKACIAGCESLERTGENAFAAVVAVKVGPVSARFRGNLQMTDIQAPHRYTINFEGQGGVAGFGKGSSDVVLTSEAAEQTRLTYAAKAQVGGKLAQIGSRLVEAAAGKIADDFFKAFEAHLQARVSDEKPPLPDASITAAPVSASTPLAAEPSDAPAALVPARDHTTRPRMKGSAIALAVAAAALLLFALWR